MPPQHTRHAPSRLWTRWIWTSVIQCILLCSIKSYRYSALHAAGHMSAAAVEFVGASSSPAVHCSSSAARFACGPRRKHAACARTAGPCVRGTPLVRRPGRRVSVYLGNGGADMRLGPRLLSRRCFCRVRCGSAWSLARPCKPRWGRLAAGVGCGGSARDRRRSAQCLAALTHAQPACAR